MIAARANLSPEYFPSENAIWVRAKNATAKPIRGKTNYSPNAVIASGCIGVGPSAYRDSAHPFIFFIEPPELKANRNVWAEFERSQVP